MNTIFFLVLIAVGFSSQSPLKIETEEKFNEILNNELLANTDFEELIDELKSLSQFGDKVNVNQQIDAFLVKLNYHILEKELDPKPLPDVDDEFKWLLVTGHLTLTNGILNGLSSLQRKGNVFLTTKGDYLNLKLPLTFYKLTFDYDYSAELMGNGPYGGVEGLIVGTKFTLTLNVHNETKFTELERFKLNNDGRILVKFTGNGLVDWIINILTNVVTTFITPILRDVVYEFIRGGVDSIIDMWNASIAACL